MSTNIEWTKVTAIGAHALLDDMIAVMSMLDNGLMIEDYSDIELNGMYGELIDESILNADKETVRVSLFVPSDKPLPDYLHFLKERFTALALDVTIECEGMREEDWAESWKQYYKPIKLGRISIVPAWEDYTPDENEAVIRMDPGMAFGTGTHETTRLVMELLQDEIRGGEYVLDVGCGSGILSLCASKLGAQACAAYDIDPVAVRVTRENIEADGADNIVCGVSDLLKGVDRTHGPFDFVVANIVSDIILRMAPDLGDYITDGARVILSGIIGERAEEIRTAMTSLSYTFERELTDNDWYAMLFTYKK